MLGIRADAREEWERYGYFLSAVNVVTVQRKMMWPIGTYALQGH